jgi:hypothetical protein
MEYIQNKYLKYKNKYYQLRSQNGSGRVTFKQTNPGIYDKKIIKIYDVPKSWSTQEVVWLLKQKLPPNIGTIVNASKILDSYLGGNLERFIFIDFLNEENGKEAFRILQALEDIFDTTGMDTSFRNNTAFFKGKELYHISVNSADFPTLDKPVVVKNPVKSWFNIKEQFKKELPVSVPQPTVPTTEQSASPKTGPDNVPMKKPVFEIESTNPFLLKCTFYKNYNNFQINFLFKKILGTNEFIFDWNNDPINNSKIIKRVRDDKNKFIEANFILIFRSPEKTVEAKKILESTDISVWSNVSGSQSTDFPEVYDVTKFKDNEKLFQVTVLGGQEYPEMINYHYVWFKFNKEKTNFEDIPFDTNQRIFEEIINRFTYPSCNFYFDFMTNTEKKAIIEDEYSLVKDKFASLFPEINVIRVPIISYQLVAYEYMQNINKNSFTRDLKYEKGDFLPRFSYPEIKVNVNVYCEFKDKLNKYLKSTIWQTALFDINKLFVTKYIVMDMFPNLIAKTNPFNLHLKMFEHILASLQSKGGNIELIADSVTDPRFTIILTQTLYIECGFIYNFENKSYISNKNKSLLLLYRGNNKWDDIVLKTQEGKVHSNSFNTSILNGIYHETRGKYGKYSGKGKGACTYEFFDSGYFKKYYLINKFLHGDNSIEDNLFIIPPIHHFLLLFGNGEKFHARSKMPKDWSLYNKKNNSEDHDKDNFSGIYLGAYENMPTYLLSDYDYNRFFIEFEKLMEKSKKTFLHYLFKKYLKYKLKYLKLKNRIE